MNSLIPTRRRIAILCSEVHTNSDMRTFRYTLENTAIADTYLATASSWPMQGYRLEPSIPCQVGEPGLSLADGFEHPASTLPTRFPAALGIGHGPACGLANACALVYVAA